MALFNNELESGKVVIAVHDKYNDNDGAYSIATVFDINKNEITEHNYANGYNHRGWQDAEVDCTNEQKNIACELFKAQCNLNYINGDASYIGCIVKLTRSRKAPNKVEVKVKDWHKRYFDTIHNVYVGERILVEFDGKQAWVSAGCIKEVVLGHSPWWA